ncbi:coatomer epsilon subunit-domain containing protein [Nitzschia inconspicua]|uniref:Coatomer subunit epsilon n=1 Tax=Nitzschia inconspicua TaxID=303405 RepID=A0A9K3M3Q9_9STRA|nr:coatomer epsilon subunit-domain containing protein [Nitzschia inconspicua]
MAAEPDELYTLRAQFWLGHYQMALDEGKSIARRPMSPELKEEREAFVARCAIAMKDYSKVTSGETPALQALALQAQYEALAASGDGAQTQSVILQLQSMLGDGVSPLVQLIAANVFLQAGMKKEALACVHNGSTLEQVALCAQIYITLDRLDLAKQSLQQMRKMDEDSILTQVTSVYIALATGSSMASEASHTLNQLSEQYGPSPMLLNLMACAFMQAGKYSEAESKLEQARSEFAATDADTLVNTIVALQYQQKPVGEYLIALKQHHPNHFLSQGLDTVQGAFDREAIKYRVAA